MVLYSAETFDAPSSQHDKDCKLKLHLGQKRVLYFNKLKKKFNCFKSEQNLNII